MKWAVRFPRYDHTFCFIRESSILGPLFFPIYINDIVADINSSIKLFADDTSLYMIVDDPVDAAETLNTDLTMKWLVKFNPDKPQFPSLDMVRPKYLCSDTMLMILLSIMSGG
jgi:hypothetical protein